jgi:hypothetical protein
LHEKNAESFAQGIQEACAQRPDLCGSGYQDVSQQELVHALRVTAEHGVGIENVNPEALRLVNQFLVMFSGTSDTLFSPTDSEQARIDVIDTAELIGAGISLATAAKTALKSGGGLLDRLKGLFGGGEKATASFGDVKTVLESAQAPYKGSTVIGHALSKHAGRNPDIWGKVTGSMSTWNEQAMKHLREIARAPGEFKQVTTDKGLTFMEKWLPDGRGVRLNMDGTFKGFID